MRLSGVEDALWTIPRERVKKDRAHTVPLSAATAVTTLAALPRFTHDGFVFSSNGGRSPSSNFSKIKARLDQLSGVGGWRVHDIRRTVRTKLAELGIPREVANKATNHEDGKIDRAYNRYSYMARSGRRLSDGRGISWTGSYC